MAKGTMNKVVLLGRLGQDPDIRYTQSGTPVGKISVATVESVKSGDGYEDKVEWHKVVIFGKTAEFVGNYATKGSMVLVEGSLKTSAWEDQGGNKRYSTEIIARELQLVGGSKNGNGDGDGSSKPQSTSKPKSAPKASDPDDDCPF